MMIGVLVILLVMFGSDRGHWIACLGVGEDRAATEWTSRVCTKPVAYAVGMKDVFAQGNLV